MQKARRHPTASLLRQLVGTRFQVLFHSPSGVLFTFPSRYLFTIGRQGVFSLAGWSPQIQTGFHVPGRTQVLVQGRPSRFRVQGYYLLWLDLSRSLPLTHDFVTLPIRRADGSSRALQPPRATAARYDTAGFGLFPFRSPLLRESRFLSFPPATKMFQFAGLPPAALCVQAGVRAHYHARVSPFGNPRIKACSAPPRGLSQPTTSFIGSQRQGIHRVPLVS